MPYFIETIEKEFYTSQFVVRSEELPEDPVFIYAECSRNKEFPSGYYELQLYFSVGAYPAREHLLGVSFGKEKMDKDAIDLEIRTWVEEELSNSFEEYVKDYLKKERLFESALDSEQN